MNEIGGRYRMLGAADAASEDAGLAVAVDRWLERRVWLGELPSDSAVDPLTLLRWTLPQHPNLSTASDLVVEAGRVFIVFERRAIAGEPYVDVTAAQASTPRSLAQWAGHSQARPRRLAQAAAAVLRALQFLHGAGLVHGELSPARLLVGEHSVGDLPGVSVGGTLLERLCERRGPPSAPYAAPEVLAGSPPSAAADIYSLGATLFETLTGQRVRELQDPEQLRERLRTAGALPRFASLIGEMLEVLDEHRPSAAAALARLEGVLEQPLSLTDQALRHSYYPRRSPMPSDSSVEQLDRLQRLFEQLRRGTEQQDARTIHLRGRQTRGMLEHACTLARLNGLTVEVQRDARALWEAVLARVGERLPHAPEVPEVLGPQVLVLEPAVREQDADLVGQAIELATRRAGLCIVLRGDAAPRRTGCTTIALSPAAAEELRAIACAMLPGLAQRPWLAQLPAAADGDVDLAVELVQAQIEADPEGALCVPVERRARLAQRVRGLPAPARLVLSVLASALRPTPLPILRRVLAGVDDQLALLADRRLIVATPDGLRPHDAAVTDCAHRHLYGRAARTTHQAFARAWREHDPHERSIAHHLLLGDEIGAAVDRLLAAPAPATADLQLASDRLAPADRRWPDLIGCLARRLRADGELDRALEVAERLDGAGRTAEPNRALLLRAELLIDAGLPGQALDALGQLEGASPERELLAARAQVLLGDFELAAEHAERGRDAAPPAALRARLDNALALAWSYGGRHEAALELLAPLGQVAERLGDLQLAARLSNSRAIASQRLDRVAEARRCYLECVRKFRACGEPRLAATALLNLGTLAHGQHDFALALRSYREARSHAAGRDPDLTIAWALANEGNLALLFGDVDAALTLLRRAGQIARRVGGGSLLGHILLYEAELHLREGRLQTADARLQLAREQFSASDESATRSSDWIEAELALEGDQLDRARQAIARLDKSTPETHAQRWRVELLRARRSAGDTADRPSTVIGHLRRALRLLGERPSERRWQIHALWCEAAASCDDPGRAAAEAERFHESLAALRRRIPAGNVSTFDERPDIARARRRVERSRAAEEQDPSARVLRRVLELCRALEPDLPPAALGQRLLDGLLELTGGRHACLLLGDGEQQELAATRGRSGAAATADPDRALIEAAIRGGRCVTEDDETARSLCAPLRAGGRVLGAVLVELRRSEPIDLATVESFAAQAASVYRSAQLLEEAASEREALTRGRSDAERRSRELAHQLAGHVQRLDEAESRLRFHEQALAQRISATELVGSSEVMQQLSRRIDRAAEVRDPVWIEGEPGTGKEAVARALHGVGPCRAEPFVVVRCHEVPRRLLAAELFGVTAGAIAGVRSERAGALEVSEGGTLLLDEVLELDDGVQRMLLAALERGTFTRLGDSRPRPVRCRIVVASSEAAEPRIASQRFSRELQRRLTAILLQVPPLRVRAEDIPALVNHVVGGERRVAPAAMAALVGYPWPRNVRQLEAELRRASALARNNIELQHLSPALRAAVAAPGGGGLQAALRGFERQVIRRALADTGFNVTAAAERLGISRVVLHRKMRALGIVRGEATAGPEGVTRWNA